MSRAIALGCGLAAASTYCGAAIFRRWMREKHGVATSLLNYAKLRYRLRGGWDSSLLLLDFDRTITTAACGTSCHGVIESCAELSVEYRAATKKLFEKYYPLETSATLTREEKIPIMTEWYTQAHTLLLKEPFTPTLLSSASQNSKAALRPGFDELHKLARENGAPLVVCSAGLGNVVYALLQHLLPPEEAVHAKDIPIVSNWLKFAEGTDRLTGFSEPLLHMYNKDGAFIKSQLGAERWEKISSGRDVCILLGDGLGDAAMADGLGVEHVLKIGFLNETEPVRVAERLPAFEAAYDAVILDDRSFEFVLGLLRGMK